MFSCFLSGIFFAFKKPVGFAFSHIKDAQIPNAEPFKNSFAPHSAKMNVVRDRIVLFFITVFLLFSRSKQDNASLAKANPRVINEQVTNSLLDVNQLIIASAVWAVAPALLPIYPLDSTAVDFKVFIGALVRAKNIFFTSIH